MTQTYTTITSDKSKTTALLLCVFLGFVGAHYFYVGRYGRGLLFLCTFGLLFFGWVLDIFTILGGGFQDSGGAPLRK